VNKFLSEDAGPPPVGSIDFLRSEWESIRDSTVRPLDLTGLAGDGPHREEFLRGAELLRFLGPKAKRDKRTRELMTPRPAQLLIADAVENADRFLGLLAPRRSTKTSAMFAIAMGRISNRDDYRVGYAMATTALKGRARFKEDIAAPLEFLFPDKKTRPFTINYAGGSESIRWKETGSLFQFLAPKGDGFRSDAWDLILIDEGGEAEPEMAEDILAGAGATMDTIPDAQLVVMGTAGDVREGGLLWPTLKDGREGKNRTSLVAWSAPEGTTVDDLKGDDGEKDWEKAKVLLIAGHPGIGHGSELIDIEPNFWSWKPERFLKEYLGIFTRPGGASFMNYPAWLGMADTGRMPSPPSHFRLAFKVHPLQTSASIVAVWRVDRKVNVGVVDTRKGVTWLYPRLLALAAKYNVPIAYDTANSVDTAEADRLKRAKRRPQIEGLNWNQVSTGAAATFNEIETGNVVHYGTPELNDAVRVVVKRGTRDSKRWAYGRPPGNEEADITTLEAFSIGLRAYDEAKPRVPITLITSESAA